MAEVAIAMSILRPGDEDMHYSDNSHRWIAPPDLEQSVWEADLRAHVSQHRTTMGGPEPVAELRECRLPQMPVHHDPVPRVPSPRLPNPRVPTSRAPGQRTPTPRVPAPRVPNPRVPNPRVPNPRVPSQRTSGSRTSGKATPTRRTSAEAGPR